MAIAKRYVDESEKINKQIRESYEYFFENNQRFHDCRRYVYQSSLTDKDRDFLSKVKWPMVEFNTLKPYVSRLRGEFSKQTPSIEVCSKADATQTDYILNNILESHIRAILDEANQNQFSDNLYEDSITGGYSVAKVYTDYESENSFNQVIKLERVYDPTLCFFDPLARMSHKGDGQYCGEHFPMRKEEVEEIFGLNLDDELFVSGKDGFSWYYQTQTQKIALVCHFYKKKNKEIRKVMLADGRVMEKQKYQQMVENWSDVTEPPVIVKERNVKKTIVCRYTLIGGIVREYIETDFSYLPLVFVDGDSKLLNYSGATYQRTIPFIEPALASQRMKNFTGQAFLNDILTLMQQKIMMPIDAFPEKMEQAKMWLMPQLASVLLYNDRDPQGNPITPPTPIVRQPIDPSIYNSFVGADDAVRSVLSTFDVSEGVNNNDLSGKAIVEAATQSNSVAMPNIMNFNAAITQIGNIILDLIPKYYVTERTIPIIDASGERSFVSVNNGMINFDYDPTLLSCMVKPAVNFEIQKQRSLDLLISLSESLPAFGALMNQPQALGVILDNISIRGGDKLKQISNQAATQPPQPNPQMMAVQAKMQEIQGDIQYKMAQLQNEQQKMQLDAQNQAVANQIKYLQLQIEQQQLELSKYQTILQAELDSRDQNIQVQKAGVEQEAKLADLQMAAMDMRHKHDMDVSDRIDKMINENKFGALS